MDCGSEAAAAALSAYLALPGWRYLPLCGIPAASAVPAAARGLLPASFPDLPDGRPEAQALAPAGVARDPRQWSRPQVYAWLEWCTEQFSLPSVDLEQFHMNGKAMCLLTKSDFVDRAPRVGDVLFNILNLLLQKQAKPNGTPCKNGGEPNVSASLLRNTATEPGHGYLPWPRSVVSSDFHNVGQILHDSSSLNGHLPSLGAEVDSTVVLSPAPSSDGPDRPRTIANGVCRKDGGSPPDGAGDAGGEDASSRTPSPEDTGTDGTQAQHQQNLNGEQSLDKINVRLLWDFLQQLLNDSEQRYHRCIVWKDKSKGIFKIVDPHRLARLWGMQKNHLNMNFDKMSRALRYYYRVKILQKEPGERHCYRFLRHPSELRQFKQRSLLCRDPNMSPPYSASDGNDVEGVLDMSIKEESSPPPDGE